VSRLPHRSVRRRAERGDPDRVLVRRAGRRAAAHAALLVALSFLLCAGLVLLIVITGQQHAADNALRAATGRADDMIDPPQGIALLLQHADGHVQTSPGGGADLRAVQLPSGGRSSDISSYAAPQLRTWCSPPSRPASTPSPAPPSPARDTPARCRPPWTPPTADAICR